MTGGATAVLEGWRESTVDIDIRLEPDTDNVMRAIVDAKNALDINIELASPPDFVPELDGWRDRSPFVLQVGAVTVRHFDPYSQTFSKIKRGLTQDLADVQAMLDAGLVERARARELFHAAMPRLFRYPAIDPAALNEQSTRRLRSSQQASSRSQRRSGAIDTSTVPAPGQTGLREASP